MLRFAILSSYYWVELLLRRVFIEPQASDDFQHS